MSFIGIRIALMIEKKVIEGFFIDRLRNAGLDEPEREFNELLLHSLNISELSIYRADYEISSSQLNFLAALVERRVNGEPLQYIIGEVEFYDLKLKVGSGVLIPRPETELLVEQTVELIKSRIREKNRFFDNFKALDLCTGCGCIALSIAKAFPLSAVYGVDISQEALEYAKTNRKSNNITNVVFLQGSLYEPVKAIAFDLIVSNPPYIKSGDIASLQREIALYEPHIALDGGADGLDYYNDILDCAKDHLNDNGMIVLELGYGLAGKIIDIAQMSGFNFIEIHKDYAQIDRIAVIGKR
ncbi:N5-glutamine S-adenosyl-L-methionine-dependent methyltransferase [Candidatus Magnetoovum chiemensis]|nr:N5-glutamine S-adenosyl-L-methionine-dependent methyltransferase [Candidatus Magnetoovum chiemensis]